LQPHMQKHHSVRRSQTPRARLHCDVVRDTKAPMCGKLLSTNIAEGGNVDIDDGRRHLRLDVLYRSLELKGQMEEAHEYVDRQMVEKPQRGPLA
jgi:hypothetical protein